MPNGMSVDDRDPFQQWHDKLTREGYMFDFRPELLKYCESDVLLLKQGCMTFKCEFEAKAGFDPFDKMTIASKPTPSPANRCSGGAVVVSTSRLENRLQVAHTTTFT